MDQRHEQFRDRLIGAERTTPSLKERYDQEVRQLLEHKLSARQKIFHFLVLLVALFLGGRFIFRLLATELTVWSGIGSGVALIFLAGWLYVILKSLRRGTWNIKSDPSALAGMYWVFTVFMITLFMLHAGQMENPIQGIGLVLKGFVFLMVGVVFLMGNTINQEDLQTRESLLKTKYQLVELNERLTKSDIRADKRIENQANYTQREEQIMYDKKLSPIRKWGMVALIPVMLAQTAAFSYALFAEWGLPILAKAGFGLGIVFSLMFAAILVRIVAKGSYNIKSDPNIITGITWVFLVFFITIVMMLAGEMRDPVRGIGMVLNTLVFLIFGVVFLLQNTIHQANLRTREKLQEIENQLADLNKRLAG